MVDDICARLADDGQTVCVQQPTGTVSFLFTDIEGSTGLWEARQDAMGVALALHDQVVRGAILAHGGVVFSTGGDGFAAAFTRCPGAVAAALDAQAGLDVTAWPEGVHLRVRMGVHTGDAQERDGNYYGPPVNRAARVMGTANGGQVVVSGVSAGLLAAEAGIRLLPLGAHVLRGVAAPVELFGVESSSWAWIDVPPTAARPTGVHLPRTSTEFVGRTMDIAALASELVDRRRVTLTGPGGVGKTRLAVEAGWSTVDRFPGGTWIVELAPVVDPLATPNAIATTLGVYPQDDDRLADAVASEFSGRRALVILDNCEHLLDEVAEFLSQVGDRCPDVTWLCTSREPLGISGEFVRPVASLDPQLEAVELFRALAVAADASFEPTDAELPAIIRVCERLDGIPLAIELAAAWVRALSVEQLADRLDDRFRLLRGGTRGAMERHQTLRATVDWSYDRLDDAERHLFDQLSVFAGGFDLDVAEAVAVPMSRENDQNPGECDDVLSLIGRLVDTSMVVADRGPEGVRYRLLETLRQYGEERLGRRGGISACRDRHRDVFAIGARKAQLRLTGSTPEFTESSGWFAREWDNLRAAVVWSVSQDDLVDAVELCDASFDWSRNQLQLEHADWVRQTAELPSVGPDLPASLLICQGEWAIIHGEFDEAIQRTTAAAEQFAPGPDQVRALTPLCLALYQSGRGDELSAAMDRLEEVVSASGDRDLTLAWLVLLVCSALAHPDRQDIYRQELHASVKQSGNPVADAWLGFTSALDALYAGDTESALQRINDALGIAEQTGNRYVATTLRGLVLVALAALGDPDSDGEFRRTLDELVEADNWITVLWALESLGEHWATHGQIEQAAILLGYLEEHGQNSRRAFSDRAGALDAIATHPQGHALMARGAAMTRQEVVASTFAALDRNHASPEAAS